LPGSHNDINVLEHSSLFTELAGERTPPVTTQSTIMTTQ
jgi:hypothetical protein